VDDPLRRVPATGGGGLTGGASPSNPDAVDLSVELPTRRGPWRLPHPILPASGTFGYGEEFEPFIPPGTFAAIVPKSISVEVRRGNAPPRCIETPAGLLNSIGLQNPGLEAFRERYLPMLRRYGAPILVNVVGKELEDYVTVVDTLHEEEGVAGFELNVSCPNVKEGLRFGLDPDATGQLVAAVREVTDLPLMAKLTPNVTDIVEQARAAEEAGADIISLVNTLRGMMVDWRTRRSMVGTATGGLSGPAIRPVALRMVWEVASAVDVPVCGIGGITDPEHVLDFTVVGASLVQVGTHLYRDPACLIGWLERLEELLAAEGIARLSDLRGTFEPPR